MVAPRFRSRTFRRKKVRLPSGIVALHHVKRNPPLHKCAVCKKELKGIPRLRPYKMQKLGISKKSVERAYGGNLCSGCSRQKIKEESRV